MKKLSTIAFVIVLCLGTTALLATSGRTITADDSSEAQFANDGAYRDGVYMGRFAAEHRQPSHPGSGRWSSRQDRAMFNAGYQRGYGAFVTRAGANAQHVQPAK